jgi:hypothetical protein
MLNKSLYFSHAFDAKMHYAMHYSLLKIEDHDEIYIHDSVLPEKCNQKKGRWNFIIDGKDYSHGIYQALEVIRQSLFSAMESNKKSVDITLVQGKSNSDTYYVIKDSQELENGKCNARIPKQIFFKVVEPVLEEMLKETGHQLTTKIL